MNKENKIIKNTIGILLLPIIIGVFLYIIGLFSPNSLKFPSIIEIYGDFFHSLFDESVVNATVVTSKYVLISIVTSIFIGVILSFLLNINKYIWSSFEPFIDFLRSIPVTFFIPAFAIILGVSSPNIIWILAVIPSSLIILVNVSYGLTQQNLNRLHQYQILSGHKSKINTFFKVTLFEILPFFISGFKIALSYAIVIVTVLEYMDMGNQTGLGTLISDEMEQLNYNRVYSIIIIVGLIGYILNKIIDKLFKKYVK